MPTLIARIPGRLVLLAFVIACMGLSATGASADPGRDSAKGRITQLCSVSCVQQDFSFSADSSAVGTDVSGTYKQTLANSDPNIVVTGVVTCLRVAGTAANGNVASIGGELTKGGENFFVFDPNTNTFGPARGFLIQTSDSGKFAPQPDTFSVQYLVAPVPPEGCPAPTPGLQTVGGGDVIIQNALP